jgi:hypothetical protein
MAQIGKCTNTVGCTLAYTGQEIRFEGSAVCPECGRPLTLLTRPKTGGKLWLVILALVALVAIAGGGFYAVERMLTPSTASTTSDNTKTSATPAASATQTQSDGKMVDGKSQVPADVLDKVNNKSNQSPSPQAASSAASPSVTPSPETQQSPPGPNESRATMVNRHKVMLPPPRASLLPPGLLVPMLVTKTANRSHLTPLEGGTIPDKPSTLSRRSCLRPSWEPLRKISRSGSTQFRG